MTGKHEPPTQRSFYISVATSTLRAGILIAAVVVGVLVVKNAFPGNESQALSPVSSSPSAVVPSGGKPSPRAGVKASPPAKPRIKGVVVQVLNGTSTTGLAASTSLALKNAGYTVRTPGNAALTQTTTLYYRSHSKIDAELMQQRFFPKSVLKPAPPSVTRGVDIQVIVGADVAASGLPSSSPSG